MISRHKVNGKQQVVTGAWWCPDNVLLMLPLDAPSNSRDDRKARGDDKRKKKEGKRRIKVTTEPLCPVANFYLLTP